MRLFKFLNREEGPADSNTSTAWTSALTNCLEAHPSYFRAIHPQNDLPVLQLGYLAALWDDALKGESSSICDSFLDLFEELEPYKTDVPTRFIQAVGNSEGKPKFDIYRLAETIRFQDPTDSFGPLTPRKTVSLCDSIRRWSDAFNEDGAIKLLHQQWDNIYIVRNGGAARRIAIWLRLQGYSDFLGRPPKTVSKLPAEVTPISINQTSLNHLGHAGRLVIFYHDPVVEACFLEFAKSHELFSYTIAKEGADTIAFATMPHVDGVDPLICRDLMLLHLWADSFFDPRRYLLERTTTYRN